MYLITIEGGDGSGKGIATKMLAEILEKEFTFPSIWTTQEPRRDHQLGKLAVEAVKTGEAGPIAEASLFAADRLDHSHAWIIPRLATGVAVLSERNVHSSLVYQGIVGEMGLAEVAKLNSAACIPDLTLWVDCDPGVALRRISEGTLREATLDKQEYFETNEYQVRIRAGYSSLLGGEVEMPQPFDCGSVVGPIVNDGTNQDLERKLRREIRLFLHRHPTPQNVETEVVELHLLKNSLKGEKGQQVLPILGSTPKRSNDDWLGGMRPWQVMKQAVKSYISAYESLEDERKMDVPADPLSHTVLAVVGTLSLLPGADVSTLRCEMGPVRMVTSRHTERMLKFLTEKVRWVRGHKPSTGRDAPRSELRADWQPFARLGLVVWPLKEKLGEWVAENPNGRWRDAVSAIIASNSDDEMTALLEACAARMQILGSGVKGAAPATDADEFRRWWRDGPHTE